MKDSDDVYAAWQAHVAKYAALYTTRDARAGLVC
jgi:hypothetical protein